MQQLQDAIVHLEDMNGNVSITDMTLNDFRMDLFGFMKDNVEMLTASLTGFQAEVSPTITGAVSGVIFCMRDLKGSVQNGDTHPLVLLYLVYKSGACRWFATICRLKKPRYV